MGASRCQAMGVSMPAAGTLTAAASNTPVIVVTGMAGLTAMSGAHADTTGPLRAASPVERRPMDPVSPIGVSGVSLW